MDEPEAQREASTEDKAIGRKLEELRRCNGMNQTTLAKRMVQAGRPHFRQTTVSRIERGIQPLLVADMKALLLTIFGPEAEKVWNEVWRKGDDEPFWFRLGHTEDGLPTHFPIGVDRYGRGPTDPDPAHHYTCWCGDMECPLAIALHYGWLSGRRSLAGPDESVRSVTNQAGAAAVREFAQWVAGNRAYNGSDFPRGQVLYDNSLNAELPKWVEDWIDERLGASKETA